VVLLKRGPGNLTPSLTPALNHLPNPNWTAPLS
jgi:hypothetical protein